MNITKSPYMDMVKQAQEAQKAANFPKALKLYQDAIRYYPTAAQAYVGMALVQAASRNFTIATECIDQAIDLGVNTGTTDWLLMYRAFCCREMGKIEEAHHSLDRATHRGNSWQWAKAILIPASYGSKEEIVATREKLIRDIHDMKLNYDESFAPLFTHFYLAYQGMQDDVQIHRLIYDKLKGFFPEKMLLNQSKKRPIKRVGFVSANLNKHSVGHCYWRMFKTLAERAHGDKIQYTAYVTHEMNQDELTQSIREQVPVKRLPNSVDDARKMIAADGLDLLIYTDIGMDVFTWCMAFTRLAKYQAVMGGHPVSTGLGHMDYFISSQLLHYDGWDEQYSEKPVLLRNLPVDYPMPDTSQHHTREELKMPPDKNIYTVPMTIFKVHPDFDDLMAGILDRDPNGIIVMFKFGDTDLHKDLMRRFYAKYPDQAERVYFRDWLPGPQFLSFLRNSDVVLDTPYFGGGNTSFQSLAVGTPVVTMEPTSLRDATSAGLYRVLNNHLGANYWGPLIADKPQDYSLAATHVVDRKMRMFYEEPPIDVAPLFHNAAGIHDLCDWMVGVVHK